MTLPASGTIVLGLAGGGNSIDGEFGYGGNIQSYLGVYYGRGGLLQRFPLPGNSLSMDAFYSTFKITGGTQTFYSSQSYTIPVYNTITITATGGSGGQAGQYGINGCAGNTPTPSGGGGAGNLSTFGGYVSATGGAGGGGNSGSGAPGQTVTQTYTNPVQGGSGPPSGTTITVTVGAGGAGGGGGSNFILIQTGNTGFPYYTPIYSCFPAGNAANGAQGASGSIVVTWS